jgi:MSHA biogenesis protein MshI
VLALFKKARSGGSRAGVAIGESEFALATIRRRDGAQPLLERLTVQELPAEGTQPPLGAILTQNKLAQVDMSAVVGVNDYQLVQVEAPEVLPSELRAAVRWRLRDVVQFSVDEAVVDVFEIPESSRRTESKMIFAVAAKGDAIKRIAALVGDGARRFGVIDIPELCLRNLSSLLPQDANGVAFLAINAHYAQLIITRQGLMYLARRIEFARRGVVELNGKSLPPSTIDPATVALELQRSFDYYESHFDQPAIQQLVVAPSDERAAALAAGLATEMSVKVSEFKLAEHFELAADVNAQTPWLGLLAVGAALRDEQKA